MFILTVSQGSEGGKFCDYSLYMFFCSHVQISDFGLAVTSGNLDKGSMELSGALGYVTPEYLLDGMDFFSSHHVHISVATFFTTNSASTI
jgi:hypothetical protein